MHADSERVDEGGLGALAGSRALAPGRRLVLESLVSGLGLAYEWAPLGAVAVEH